MKTIAIPYNPYSNKKLIHANGIYINYLQMQQGLIIPVFGMPEDEKAIRLFKQLFPDETILNIDSNDIAEEGGILNCITWNILASS